MKMNNSQLDIKTDSVRMLVEAGADAEEARQFVDELAEAVPEFTCKYYPGILRWVTDGDVNVEDDAELACLNLFLKFITKTEAGEFYDSDFNGLSYDDLVNMYHLNLYAEDYATPADAQYSSVEVSSFEELQKYRQWTDDWCITVSEIAFEGFSLGGTYRFFLLLRDDYRRVPKKPAGSFPSDSYGESILCVILNSDGSIFSVTNRWNAETEDNPDDYLKKLLGPGYRKNF